MANKYRIFKIISGQPVASIRCQAVTSPSKKNVYPAGFNAPPTRRAISPIAGIFGKVSLWSLWSVLSPTINFKGGGRGKHALSLLLLLPVCSFAQDTAAVKINTNLFSDNEHHWYAILDDHAIIHPLPGRPRYRATDIIPIADNILLFQKENGGWPKNYDITAILTDAQKDSVAATRKEENTTFDNGSTYTHVATLAMVYNATKIEKYKSAALKGFDFILKAQYANGGWPQYYPLENNYSRYITYNDGGFGGIMKMLKDIKDGKPEYAFIDPERRVKLNAAFSHGVACILKTQINDVGKPTAWCQQYDEKSLQPTWARKFEPPSICNGESADVVLFLMDFKNPSKEVIAAVQNAVSWFRESEIMNTRFTRVAAPRMVTQFRVSQTDHVVITDSTAPPIWTRYYELKTHRPIFCDRDSKIVYSVAEIGRERRDGYAWYTYAPQKVLDHYPEWQKKWAPDANIVK